MVVVIVPIYIIQPLGIIQVFQVIYHLFNFATFLAVAGFNHTFLNPRISSTISLTLYNQHFLFSDNNSKL